MSLIEIKKMPERHWPIRPLEAMRLGRLRDFFDAETVANWRANGLSDSDADKVATYFHQHPMNIWTGWLEAGFDYGVPEDYDD